MSKKSPVISHYKTHDVNLFSPVCSIHYGGAVAGTKKDREGGTNSCGYYCCHCYCIVAVINLFLTKSPSEISWKSHR